MLCKQCVPIVALVNRITMNRRGYSELVELRSFEERLEYLKLGGVVAHTTFGGHRYLNQALYQSDEWKRVRRQVILRDNGCDLGVDGWPIKGQIIVHHIEPIDVDDVVNKTKRVLDMDNLITVSMWTHNAIHFGNDSLLSPTLVNRTPFDTCPWKG